jgi:Thiamine pyrophosphate-requiring enzymes [acetolactate synthase, pyruvate dehydrogenase (cytochrome), glyoxylate carboligase, phosphonopyruvate decarboxylase]
VPVATGPGKAKGDNLENRMNGAQAMVRSLEAHGVSHIFGLCGDTTLPFYDAMRQLDHSITHVLTRDERSAAYMAGRVFARHRSGRGL